MLSYNTKCFDCNFYIYLILYNFCILCMDHSSYVKKVLKFFISKDLKILLNVLMLLLNIKQL